MRRALLALLFLGAFTAGVYAGIAAIAIGADARPDGAVVTPYPTPYPTGR